MREYPEVTSGRRSPFRTILGLALGGMLLVVPAWSVEDRSTVEARHGSGGIQDMERKSHGEKEEAERRRVAGEEVVVTAPRMDVPLRENPAATSVVEGETLSAMPRTIAADEALAVVPGVKVDNQANGERVHLSIRGQGILTEHGIRGIKILLDGIPLNDPTGFAPDLYDVDWATVDRIEVLRGPASSLHGGGGSGGIISITTEDGGPDPLEGRVRLDVGSHGFVKGLAQAGGSEGGLHYRFSASRNQGDGYRDHTAFAATNLSGKIRFRDTDRLHLSAIVAGTSFFNENAEGLNLEQVEEDPTQANPDALISNEYQKTRRGTLGLTGLWEITHAQSLAFTAYGRHTIYKESVPSSIIHRTFDGWGGSLQYSVEGHVLSRAHRFDVGVDLEWQDIDEYRRPNLGGGEEGPVIVSDQVISQRGAGIFAFDRIDLGHRWNLVLGVRHDEIDNELEDQLRAGGVDRSGGASFSESTARVGIAWNWKPAAAFFASWGQGFLPPATEELASNPESLGGFNTGLRPATSHGLEVGIRGGAGGLLAYDAALFRLKTGGDFGRYRIPERPLETFYRNAGDSERYGLEASLAWFPLERLAVRLAYTWSHFIYGRVALGDQVLTGTWLPNSPRNMAYLDVEYSPVPRLTLGGSVDVRSRAYIDGSNATWIDGYTLVHLRLRSRIRLGARSSVELMAAVRNLTDTGHIAFTEPDPDGNSYQPGPAREYFAGAVLTF